MKYVKKRKNISICKQIVLKEKNNKKSLVFMQGYTIVCGKKNMGTLNSEQERIICMADVIMESGVCSSRDFGRKIFAKLCGCTPAFLDSLLFEETGYKASEFICMCRLYTMKRLLLEGAGYEVALKSSGFRSPRQLERALDYIVI